MTKAAKKPAAKKAAPVNTKAIYDTLYAAFEHFNKALFDGKLPPVMLVLHRRRNAHGYFWQDMWKTKGSEKHLSEIALNPETMGRDAKEVLSTLVHEMVHHEQHVFGKPSKSGHNVEWCEWMERIDLTPIGVGNCKGKRSGSNFTHKIVEGGAFDKAAGAFLKRKTVDMNLFSKTHAKLRKQDRSKIKHTCENCGTNIWGKEGIHVLCCDEVMRPVYYA